METVTVAVGSNLGDRMNTLRAAGKFLSDLSDTPIKKASVWESEPVGKAKYRFYNTVAEISTELSPGELLKKMKSFEQACGREKNPERWGPRILDLDIIRYGNLVMQNEELVIPHPEYSRRLFVLLPMAEINKSWLDPITQTPISKMIKNAPEIDIQKTDLNW